MHAVRPTERVTNMVSHGHFTRHGGISSVLELPSSLDFPSLRIFPTVRAPPPFPILSTYPLHLNIVLLSIDRCVRSSPHLGLEPTRHVARGHRRVRLRSHVVERTAHVPWILPHGWAWEVKTNEKRGRSTTGTIASSDGWRGARNPDSCTTWISTRDAPIRTDPRIPRPGCWSVPGASLGPQFQDPRPETPSSFPCT